MTRHFPARFPVAALAFTALVLGACGGGDDSEETSSGTRTVEVEMRDIAFSPDEVEVSAGETIRFVFTNVGKIKHDAFIGDEAAQEQHETEMRAMDDGGGEGMEHGGGDDDEDSITIDPGETGELTRTFQAGERLLIGCHQLGHYAAGMKLTISLT